MMMLFALLFACRPAAAPVEALDADHADVVVYAIRHFEKETTVGDDDPVLTEVGVARAQALAVFLSQVDLHAAYSTPTNRTRQTLEPVAAAQDLEIDTAWQGGLDLAAHILATHDGQTVISAGHSNTVPDLIAGLGAPAPEIYSYGELWVVTVTGGSADAVLTPFD